MQREPSYWLSRVVFDGAEEAAERCRLDDRRVMALIRGREDLGGLEPRRGIVCHEALGHREAPELVGECQRAMGCFATVRPLDALSGFLKHWRINGTDWRGGPSSSIR